jgi:uncharacterized protein
MNVFPTATQIGLISDTHSLLRREALDALQGCHLILHAGDVGSPEILANLRTIAPVVAIRGNVDTEFWASALPETEVVTAAGVLFYMLHDVERLDLNPGAAGFSIVLSGHSHKPMQEFRGKVLYINPGSAGPRRFTLPVTVARLDLKAKPWHADILPIAS